MALEQLKGKSSKSDTVEEIVIKLNIDGSTNLNRRLVQKISDRLTILFPRTAFGILNEGKWRDIESEAPTIPTKPLGLRTGYTPKKSSEAKEVESGGGNKRNKKDTSLEEALMSAAETAGDEALAHYESERIIYHEELKMYVRDKREYLNEKIKMHAIIHAMLSSEAIDKLEKTENYEDEIARPRDGEKLWDCIRKVLIVGVGGPSQEMNRRAAERRWELVTQGKGDTESLTDFKERFLDQYSKYVAAGGTKLDEEALAKRFMWTVDIEKYADAVSSILNDEGTGRSMPETVEKMCARIRKHVNFKTTGKGKAKEQADTDLSNFVWAATAAPAKSRNKSMSDESSESECDSEERNKKKGTGKRKPICKDNKPDNRNGNGGIKRFVCHECGEKGHYATDCQLRKELNKLREAYRTKNKKTASEESETEEIDERNQKDSKKGKPVNRKSAPEAMTSFVWTEEDVSPFNL